MPLCWVTIGAASATVAALTRVGYTVKTGTSDWQFGPDDVEMQLELISGFAAAAREAGDIALPDLVGWTSRRREFVEDGSAGLLIGHLDVFARASGKRWGDRSQSNSTSSPIG